MQPLTPPNPHPPLAAGSLLFMIQKIKQRKHPLYMWKYLFVMFFGGYFPRSNQQVAVNCKCLAAATSSGGIYSLLRQEGNKSKLKKKNHCNLIPHKDGQYRFFLNMYIFIYYIILYISVFTLLLLLFSANQHLKKKNTFSKTWLTCNPAIISHFLTWYLSLFKL